MSVPNMAPEGTPSWVPTVTPAPTKLWGARQQVPPLAKMRVEAALFSHELVPRCNTTCTGQAVPPMVVKHLAIRNMRVRQPGDAREVVGEALYAPVPRPSDVSLLETITRRQAGRDLAVAARIQEETE